MPSSKAGKNSTTNSSDSEKNVKKHETKRTKSKVQKAGNVVAEQPKGSIKEEPPKIEQLAQRLLTFIINGEWGDVEAIMKDMEKIVKSDQVKPAPLAGLKDPSNGMTPLMYAVKTGRTTLVDGLIRLGCDLCSKNYKGKAALHMAVDASNQLCCQKLLNVRAAEQLALQTGGRQGDTALHLATRRHKLGLIRFLIDAGASVDVQNAEGQTPLHIVASDGDENLIKYFYSAHASADVTDNQDRTPLHLAAEKGYANIIEILADKFKANIEERTKDGNTLMHIASLNGHADCAAMLFKKGVYLHMPNKEGARSIHTAAKYGHVGIIRTLIEKGESVDVPTNDNRTALHIAAESGKHLVVETLLGNGADVYVRGGEKCETPLHLAAKAPDGAKCALMLMKSGDDPNLTNADNNTSVHIAAKHGNLETLQYLLKYDGNLTLQNKAGETPLHLACRNCRADIVVHVLKAIKEDEVTRYVNTLTEDGYTALHYACMVVKEQVELPRCDRFIVRALLEHGADITVQAKNSLETALHCVATAGNNDMLEEVFEQLTSLQIQQEINRQTMNGWSPLLIASHLGHIQLLKTLLSHQARVDVFDVDGRSALHLAAEKGFLTICDILLTHNAFINSKAHSGRTALHLAAMNGFSQLVSYLVQEHHAVIDILTLNKQTPLHLAAGAGQLDVCRLLLELGANIDAMDDDGQKPIHAAAQNNYANVVHLFLQRAPTLVLDTSKDGNTCTHLAAMQGSIRVIEELMKFDRLGVITARNALTDATPLQLAAEGGHTDVVQTLAQAGASCVVENSAGYTAAHLAAKNDHVNVLEVLKDFIALRIYSKKLGVTSLHIAAYYDQSDAVRELLQHIPGAIKSERSNSGAHLVSELGSESGMTPLHFAAYAGNENVVRLLLNAAGVEVDDVTTENGYNPLHLACIGGHMSVVGLVLNRSPELLHSVNRHGRTGLHIASVHGHYEMAELLLAQGADVNARDRHNWTPLHCASKSGHLNVVQLLMDSGGSPSTETNAGCAPIWFAAAESHNDVLEYLMHKEHDTYALMQDEQFVYSLMKVSKSNGNKPLEEFILVSPAPVDTAAKLSNIFITLSIDDKDKAKDLSAAGKQCEAMATELLALAAGTDGAGRILTAVDRRSTEFLDVLIENEQKEVIAHTVVQRYLQELWRGSLVWSTWKQFLLFFLFVFCPPIWVFFTLPCGHNYYKVPRIKYMSYLTSHVYLMFFLLIVGITPIYQVVRADLIPYWHEWVLLVLLSGLLLLELTNPSDKSGLGWIKLFVLLFSMVGVAAHLAGFVLVPKQYWPTLLFCRNQFFALAFLLACVQIFEFLSFHQLFGPWAVIIGNVMIDLGRFLAVLVIFVFGFSMHFVALNQPFKNFETNHIAPIQPSYFVDVQKDPIEIFELLFFAVFKLTDILWLGPDDVKPFWAEELFKILFGVYMLISVIVLMKLLIAMMTDTYQRIQAQSDIEWKFGLSKLIRSMHRTTTAPSPINLVTSPLIYVFRICKSKVRARQHRRILNLSAKTRATVKWLSKLKKNSTQTTPPQLAPQRIEDVTNWVAIAKKYRSNHAGVLEKLATDEDDEDGNSSSDDNVSEVIE